MLERLKKNNKEGFTIIEVMIVLAIAGLILLIVFLAVPALQRNARNTDRKNDVASLGSAVSEYIDNQNGTLPTANGSGTTNGSAAYDFAQNWKPGYYTAAELASVNFGGANPLAGANPNSLDKIIVTAYSTCTTAGTAGSTTDASSRSVAITYDVEAPGGTNGMQEECTTAQ
jgi:prepilin-type N-terminal cleavage/methylation domain-containing protein